MPAPLISPPPGDESPRPRPGALLPALSLALLLATIFTGGLFWASRAGVLIPATPTPSATPRAPLTATPDFRATRTAEDAATQIAYAAALATRTAHSLAETTPDAPAGGEPSPAVPMGNLTATAIAELATEEGSQVAATAAALATADALATAQAILDSVTPPDFPLETPTEVLVNVPVVVSGETPTHPSEGAPPAPALTDTPTETPSPTFTSPPPTPSATPFATPTPTLIFALNSMRGVIDRQNAAARVGPASFYTQTATIGMGTQVSLLARDAGGEWVYICCTPNNAPAWIRSVSARPVENPTLPAPLSDLNQNDIRWLAVRGPDPGLAPVPMLAPPSPADFPMFRHDRGNTARVAALPRLPLAPAWSNQGGLAGQPYTSGAVMAGSTVFAASGDGHLYAFQRDSGSQAWRFNLGEVVRTAPLIDGAQVFVVTESGRLFALDNQGQAAVQRWMTPLGGAPRAAILPAPNRLVLTMRQADGERLLIVDRGNGAVLRNINLGGGQSVAPALSAQTVYVASDLIRAYDLWSGDLVWQSNEGTQFTTPPLLMWPGVEAASELYAADAMGRLLAYDANTGQLLWATAVSGTATGIAANNTTVFVSGPGFVRAFARMQRAEGQMLWSAGITGSVPGGPIVDEARVLAANDNGTLQYLDAVTGALIAANVQTPPLAGAALAVEPWFFAPGQNAVLFAARESP